MNLKFISEERSTTPDNTEGEGTFGPQVLKTGNKYFALYSHDDEGQLIPHRCVPTNQRRVCVFCREVGERFSNGRIKQTNYMCDPCDVYLCRPQIRDCFQKYHAKQEQCRIANVIPRLQRK